MFSYPTACGTSPNLGEELKLSVSGRTMLSKIPPSMLKVSRMTRVCQNGVPERRWSAHSMGRLCVMRHINARIVISRSVRGSVAMMAIGA